MPTPSETLEVEGREVKVTNPAKVFFPQLGVTKLDVVRYYLDVMPGVLRGCGNRPTTMYRWPNGVDAPDDAFFQKRVPHQRPEWLRTTTVSFPSGRTAEMLVVRDAAHVAWMMNLGCIDINPWPVTVDPEDEGSLDHPDELRVDLDPTPGIPYSDVCRVAPVAREVLAQHGLVGAAKTSGKRGLHIYARIEPLWGFTEVRRAALALSREVERRMPRIATTAWWKEERRGVFVDYNQNARDRTIASAYSIRPVAGATVSAPVSWNEIDGLEPADFRIDTVPGRFRERGDLWAEIDSSRGRLDALLELATRDAKGGLGDAPWPPNFPKAAAEPPRVQPSRRRAGSGARGA